MFRGWLTVTVFLVTNLFTIYNITLRVIGDTVKVR